MQLCIYASDFLVNILFSLLRQVHLMFRHKVRKHIRISLRFTLCAYILLHASDGYYYVLMFHLPP